MVFGGVDASVVLDKERNQQRRMNDYNVSVILDQFTTTILLIIHVKSILQHTVAIVSAIKLLKFIFTNT